MTLAPIVPRMLEEIRFREEVEKLPPCEAANRAHDKAMWGHVPDAAAEFLAIAPCGNPTFKCRGWVVSCSRYGQVIDYTGCGDIHEWEDFTVIPLREG